MKSANQVILLVLLNCCAVVCFSQEKYSKVRIRYPASDISVRNRVVGLLEIDHFHEEEGAVISEVKASLLDLLPPLNIKFEILVDDVAKNLEVINNEYYARQKQSPDRAMSRIAIEQPGSSLDNIIVKPAAFELKPTFGGYYSFDEMNLAMNNLVATYPAIAKKISIGKTYLNNDIWLIKISDNVAVDDLNEPEVLYMGLQHAREAITGASMIFFMQYLCERYYADARIKGLVDNREIYIIPCFNPDGWEYNQSGGVGSMWRKNRKPNTGCSGCAGVDLNRNWGVDWAECDDPIQGDPNSCGTSSKSADTYWGTGAFSELETQAVRNFVKSHHLAAAFDQHAFGPYYSLPFGRQSLHSGEMSVKGQNFYTAVPALMGKYNGMRAADSYDALGYEVAGGFKDWMLMGELGSSIGTGLKDTVWAMTGEGGAGGGTDGNDFWAPIEKIIPLSKGMCYQNLQLAFAAGTYVDLQDANDIALTSLTGNVGFSLKRLGLGNDPVTVTLIPLENIQTVGAAVTVSAINYYDSHNGSISYSLFPALGNGQRVKYAWKVTTGGYSYSDTITKFYNPVSLFYDDMEGSNVTTNWTVSGGWNYATDSKYAGSKSLTESPGVKYTSNSTRTATYKSTFNLSNATAAYLTFWTRHRAENGRDKLQVQVSTDGSSWAPLAGATTIKEPNDGDGSTINGNHSLTGIRDYWSQERFNLQNYQGEAALRLRFVFTSDSDPSSFAFERDEGFYIDNLKVIKSTATLINLMPVTFVNVYAKLLYNHTVQISWDATIDKEHDFFEVEKSTDGIAFTPIGKVSGNLPYHLFDHSPASGYNYYRISQSDKNGKRSFSKVVNIVYKPGKTNLIVHPNPVSDRLNLQMDGFTNGPANVQITDLHGREVYRELFTMSEQNQMSVNVQAWKPQMYIVKIYSKNMLVATQKFVKK